MKKLAIILIPLIAACSIGKRPETTIYAVMPPADTQKKEAPSCGAVSSIQIMQPTSAPGLTSSRIAVFESPQKLNYYTGAKWTAQPAEMLAGVLVDSFEKSSAFKSVSTDLEDVSTDLILLTDIRDYEVTNPSDPSIKIRLVAKLIRSDDRNVLTTIPYEKEVKPGANKMASIVDAFNKLSIDAANEIAAKSSEAQNTCYIDVPKPVTPRKRKIR